MSNPNVPAPAPRPVDAFDLIMAFVGLGMLGGALCFALRDPAVMLQQLLFAVLWTVVLVPLGMVGERIVRALRK